MNQPAHPHSSFFEGGRGPVELNIDELVIRGVSPHDRHRIAQDIERELTRLLKEGGTHPVSGAPAGKEGCDAAQKSQSTKHDSLARRIAWEIYQQLETSG